jgi:hypothetical protein
VPFNGSTLHISATEPICEEKNPESETPGMNKQSEPSSLFLVRMWLEDRGNGQAEWQGKVQYVLSGEARSFCDWQELVDALLQLLPSGGSSQNYEPGSAKSKVDSLKSTV